MPFADLLSQRTVMVLLAVGLLAAFDLSQRVQHRNLHLLFACVFGTLCSVAMLKIAAVYQTPGSVVNAYVSAVGILLLILGWKALFGPWEVETKVTILGIFLFWLGLSTLSHQAPQDRNAHLIAGAVALIPAIVWCRLFLKYHTERRSAVLLLFFAGMLSTLPILFYDSLVRHGVELQFFLVKIVPESFHQSANSFVHDTLGIHNKLTALLATEFVAFLLVGVLEEVSKYWVMRRSGQPVFTSVDDVLQLSVIAAIGFSFAENVVNPLYFQGFVEGYLLRPETPDVMGFFSNVLGRSVLTSMVHIVSTGVMGYFLGIAIFAKPLLVQQRARGRGTGITGRIAQALRISDERVLRIEMISIGLVSAIVLHAVFNFLVTLPDLLPGQPTNIGELLGSPAGSSLRLIPLLLLPALLYVVGGFWLLTWLFLCKQNREEHGHIQASELFVRDVDGVAV